MWKWISPLLKKICCFRFRFQLTFGFKLQTLYCHISKKSPFSLKSNPPPLHFHVISLISISLDEDNDLEGENIHLLSEVNVFIFNVFFFKVKINQTLNILKICIVIRFVFEYRKRVCFGLEAQFSQLIKSQIYSKCFV